MSKLRAFSLVETLMALALVGVVLILAAGLLQEYLRISRHQAAHTRQANTLQLALRGMAQDTRQAVMVVSPPAPPHYPHTAELRFLRVRNPQSGSTLPAWLPTPVPSQSPLPPWDPHDPTLLEEVCYFKDDRGQLWRARGEVGFATHPQETVLVAEEVDGLAVRSHDREVEIRVSWKTGPTLQIVSATVGLPQW